MREEPCREIHRLKAIVWLLKRVTRYRHALVPVLERGGDLHEHFQPHSDDAAHRTLERLSPVPRSHAAGLSGEYMGSD